MSAFRHVTPPAEAGLSADQASALLKLGIDEPRRPIDDVLDRLTSTDGETWFHQTLERSPVGAAGRPHELLVEGQASVEDLLRIKEESKRLLREASRSGSGDAERAAALIGYFLAIAGARVHHNTLIGGRGREELDDIFMELSGASPEPYRALFARAANG